MVAGNRRRKLEALYDDVIINGAQHMFVVSVSDFY